MHQFKTMFSIAKNQELLGTMPVLLVLMFLPFSQSVFINREQHHRVEEKDCDVQECQK